MNNGPKLRCCQTGIVGMEVVFPARYVEQSELEYHDHVQAGGTDENFRAGRNTIGLGQKRMGFCTELEDVNSLALTALSRLIYKQKIDPQRIGWLGVGTETLLDKSKSIKTVLMQLLQESGNTDVEGIDFKNACYGGTAALFSACDWLLANHSCGDSSQFAVVVCADIAVYAPGPARCTGGAGAAAILLSTDHTLTLPLILPRACRATHMEHTWDFYKPDPSSEYATVDGRATLRCYMGALDRCYSLLKQKSSSMCNVNTSDIHYFCFHTPYCRLVQKSFARLLWQDLRCCPDSSSDVWGDLWTFRARQDDDSSFTDRALEQAALSASETLFNKKVSDTLLLARHVGNMYTPSLYAGVFSLLATRTATQLVGRRISLFSYGSGLAASMFLAQFSENEHVVGDLVAQAIGVQDKLQSRRCVSPEEFTRELALREERYKQCGYVVDTSEEKLSELDEHTYYLTEVDKNFRRSYKLHKPYSWCKNSANCVDSN